MSMEQLIEDIELWKNVGEYEYAVALESFIQYINKEHVTQDSKRAMQDKLNANYSEYQLVHIV